MQVGLRGRPNSWTRSTIEELMVREAMKSVLVCPHTSTSGGSQCQRSGQGRGFRPGLRVIAIDDPKALWLG